MQTHVCIYMSRHERNARRDEEARCCACLNVKQGQREEETQHCAETRIHSFLQDFSFFLPLILKTQPITWDSTNYSRPLPAYL